MYVKKDHKKKKKKKRESDIPYQRCPDGLKKRKSVTATRWFPVVPVSWFATIAAMVHDGMDALDGRLNDVSVAAENPGTARAVGCYSWIDKAADAQAQSQATLRWTTARMPLTSWAKWIPMIQPTTRMKLYQSFQTKCKDDDGCGDVESGSNTLGSDRCY